ncbi:MAG: hypothetical protein HEEMFOPI_01797 [Holosporales bacterium]
MWQQKGLDIPVPSFGHLSDLFETVSLQTKQHCKTLKKRLENDESVEAIVDAIGLKFDNAHEWYKRQYSRQNDRKTWRKLHIAMDQDFNNLRVSITTCETADINELEHLLESSDIPLNKVIADKAYYSIEGVQRMSDKGITPVILLPKDAVVHGKNHTRYHDKSVQYIRNKGSIYAWQKKYGYGFRALVEAQFSRIKRCIEETLNTQKLSSQKNEGIIIGNIINFWNSLRRCKSVKIA